MKLRLLFLFSIFTIGLIRAQSNAPSIQSGVTFQWSDNQTTFTQPATIESITVNGNVYFSFGVPTGYELTQLGPNGHPTNNISQNGSYVESTSASPTWNTTALDAFQSKNLNYYFEANGNGQEICDDYLAEETTTSQRFTLTYDGGIVASSSGIIAITEQNANNCYHVEFFGIPEDGGPEQSLGETFVNKGSTRFGFGGTGSNGNVGTPGAMNPPLAGSDYWLSDRVVRNAATLGIAVFYLDDIAPTGSLITKATLTAATTDNGDGKMFILTLPDNDGDGFSDVDDLDDDNDGIKDVDESGGLDPSGDDDVDGIPNYQDADFCLLNASGVCANLDFDSDGIPNHFDLDSDNDGITDVSESGGEDFISPFSYDSDGQADGRPGSDPLTMGIPSSAGTGTVCINTDNSEDFDYKDIDSDNDGIPDNIESQTTTGYKGPSGEGATIVDLDGNGLDDVYIFEEKLIDTDFDGILDRLDSDSDNDGLLDIEENGMANVLSGIDSDNDGLDDIFEGSNIIDPFDVNDEIDSPVTSILPDSDLDKNSGGDLDYRDLFDFNPAFASTIDFDGIDDYLFGDSLLNGQGELTVMGWIKIDGSNSTGPTTVFGEDSGFRLYFTDGNKLMLSMRSSSGTTHLVTGININFEEWHHVAGTFSSSTGQLLIYVDGNLEGTVTDPSLVGRTVSPSSDWNGSFEVGRRSTALSGKEHFRGDIDEIRIFNVALSADQLQQMVYQEIEENAGFVSGKVVPKPIEDRDTSQKVSWSSLLAYYSMTDIKNNTTADYSGNGHELTLMNITTLQDQTAPMPYRTLSDGDWSSESTWLYGDVWDIEDASQNKDWSIVSIENNVTTSSSHTNYGLIVGDGNELSVNGDNKIENTYYLELNGTVDLKDDSQLIQREHSDLVTSADGKIKRRQEGTSSHYWYNYWGSPVGSLGVTPLTDNNATGNNTNNTTYNLGMLKKPDGTNFEFTGALHEMGKISVFWLYTYINGVTYNDWGSMDANTPLPPGVGYTQKGTGISGTEQQYLFEGKPNNGTIVIDVTDTGGSGSVPAVSKTDYLMGNPYPSALDLHQFIDDNVGVIDGTIQLWQQWSGSSHILNEYNGGYAQVNKTGSVRAYQFVGIEGANNGSQDGTKKPSRYLPVGQGFMVEVIADGQVRFNNGQRLFIKESDHDGTYNNGSIFFKNEVTGGKSQNEEELMQTIRLEFTSVDGPDTRRELLLGFSNFTTEDFDYGYEAKNTDEGNDDLNLVFNDELMTIQAYSAISEDKSVPLKLTASGNYNYAIRLTEMENIGEEQELHLKDNLTGTYYDLRNSEQPYEFNSEAGEFADRFEVVFSQQSETLSQTEHEIEELKLYYAMGRKKIVVLNPNSAEVSNISVIDILGKTVYSNNNPYPGSYGEYDMHGLVAGTYIVQLITADGFSVAKKIIVK